MPHKGLLAIGILVLTGLGWVWWKETRPPAALFVFDFEARVESETITFRSAVGCYPFKVGGGSFPRTHTIHSIREHAFAAKLKSGRTFFVSVPDICSYVRRADGEYLGQGLRKRDRPAITEPHSIVPLTYLVQGEGEAETVRLFTSLGGQSRASGFEIRRSTVRQFNEAMEADLTERAGDRSDPFAAGGLSDRNWAGTAFLPVRGAPQLETGWIDAQWGAGSCDIIRLNEQGQRAISTIDSYASSVGALWPRLWRGTALSDLFVLPRPEPYDLATARRGFDSVIPTHYARGRIEIQPEHAGSIEVVSDPKYLDLRLRASSYFFDGIQLSNDNERKRLPFVIRCDAQDSLYIPAVLHFSRDAL